MLNVHFGTMDLRRACLSISLRLGSVAVAGCRAHSSFLEADFESALNQITAPSFGFGSSGWRK